MPHTLAPLFAPRSIAVVGASDNPRRLGRIVLDNLRAGDFEGPLYGINPKRPKIDGVHVAARLSALRDPVDLAVICTPAETVLDVLKDAARAKTKTALILSAGFGESGEEGRRLEKKIGEFARSSGVRFIGPNCLGIMRPSAGMNATFARGMARPGPMALISQSGAVATAMVDWAEGAGIGFSSVVSLGAAADLDFGDVLDFFVHDTETRAILLYIEGIRESRHFISALRAASRVKPVIALKVGRHLSGSKAAMSHTGALVGNDAVFDAALRRAGVLRVRKWSDLFDAARLIDAGRFAKGPRLAIVTNGGGPGVMAADHAADVRLELATLAPQTIQTLNNFLPPHWPHANPVDIIGDADAKRLSVALDAVLADPNVDGVLTLFCPQRVLTSADAGKAIVEAAKKSDKPVLTTWLGEPDVKAGRALCAAAHISVFDSPEPAIAAFGGLAEYARVQKLLLEVPTSKATDIEPDFHRAFALARHATSQHRTLLTEPEAKSLLACFGIPTPEAVVAKNAKEAVAAANRMGYPVVLKILSRTITHKSDVSGVKLGIQDEMALEREYAALLSEVSQKRPDSVIDGVVVQPMVYKRFGRELMVGVITDPVFGPAISVGSGGVAVERLGDSVVGLPPLNARLASAMITRTQAAKLLGAYRNVPAAKVDAIVDVLLRVSEMACSLPWIAEMDINPLVVDQDGAVALDCRIVVNPKRLVPDDRYSHMAIHPYPARLEHVERLKDGTQLMFRPIRPEDANDLQTFVRNLSDQSRYFRFFTTTRELSTPLLSRLTQIDYDRELAMLALTGEDGNQKIAGVARYAPNPDGVSCEFAVAVADEMQGHGLGRRLLESLLPEAAAAGYEKMTGTVLKENDRMLALMEEMGWSRRTDQEDPTAVLIETGLR